MSDNINIPLSKLKTPNNPGLSDEDKEKLRPNNQEFLDVFGGSFIVQLENIDAEITDITIEGSNIAEITVKYDDVLDNIESLTPLVCNLIKNIMPNMLTFPSELAWVLQINVACGTANPSRPHPISPLILVGLVLLDS